MADPRFWPFGDSAWLTCPNLRARNQDPGRHGGSRISRDGKPALYALRWASKGACNRSLRGHTQANS